ncbi:MAG: aminomethyltransferase family protein [Bryobacterales bacterium]|nr:aminomethyltransferase family protein [Bryobacterales bacterium]
MSGYSMLREGAAWLDLDARGRFRARGEDRARLLHAMTTNQVQTLKPGEGCYAFFLSSQGRILGDANLLCLEDSFLIGTEPETHDTLYQHLDKYIIADDVTLEDARQELSEAAIEGPKSASVLDQLGLPVPELDNAHASSGDVLVARITSTGQQGFRLYLPSGSKQSLIEKLTAAGIEQATSDEQRTVRIENRKPRYGEDITERHLVHETQQMHAVHLSKGCYLGQEIVERVRSRGQVHRLLTALTISGEDAVAAATPLKAGEAAAGEVTSSAFSPATGKVVALGYLRSEHAKPGTKLVAGDREAEVVG